ncbi:MAG: AEC family transporter [Candidatus Omnitrophota bacterium]
MITDFYDFYSLSAGILKIFLLIGIGYVLNTRKILKKDAISSLSAILIWASLPALIFTKITSTFDVSLFPRWYLLPLIAIMLSLLGGALGYVFQRFIPGLNSRNEFIASCSLHNAGYLPMTLIAFVCSGSFCDKMLVYIFLFIVGFNIIMWSFAPIFLSKENKKSFDLKAILNPPLITTVVSLMFVFFLGKGQVPGLVNEPLLMLGATTFPLALIVLGLCLAEYKGIEINNWQALASSIFVKLIFLPMIVFFILKILPIDDSLKFFIFLEATMPMAVSLVLIGEMVKADNRFLSSVTFYSHLLAVVTIPVWLLIFRNF